MISVSFTEPRVDMYWAILWLFILGDFRWWSLCVAGDASSTLKYDIRVFSKNLSSSYEMIISKCQSCMNAGPVGLPECSVIILSTQHYCVYIRAEISLHHILLSETTL